MKKNVALTGLTFGLVSATDGSAITSGSPAAYVTIDGGSQASATNSPVHEGNGQWSLDLTQAEMNGGVIGVLIALAGAVPVQITLVTETKVVADLNDIAAGAAMTLTADYDAAKSAAQAGDEMDLVDAPNSTAVTAIQSGLSTHSAADVAAAVWAIATSGLTAAGSIGKYLLDHIIGILATGTHTAQSGDSYAVVSNGTYGNPALQTLMADVPTNSELSTALAGADDAVLSAIAALNNLSSTAAQAAAAAALAAYGAATGTNVTDATSPLATSSQAETISQAIDALNDLSTTDVQGIIDVIAGAGWTNETLAAIKAAIDALEAGSAPTAEQNAQAVWDEAKSGHTIEGTFGAYLNMPISEIGTGSGAVIFTYTVLEPDGITPISGVTVQVSTDLAGTNRIRSGMTDADGKVVFKMDPGERHFWRYKDGYQFDNPDTEIVSED